MYLFIHLNVIVPCATHLSLKTGNPVLVLIILYGNGLFTFAIFSCLLPFSIFWFPLDITLEKDDFKIIVIILFLASPYQKEHQN